MPDNRSLGLGQVARFATDSPPQTPRSPRDFNLGLNALSRFNTAEEALRALSTQASVQAAFASAPASARNITPSAHARLVAALTPSHNRVVDTEETRSDHLEYLIRLIRNCDNTLELRRLLQLILSPVPDNESALQRRLRRLNEILQTRRRVDIARGETNITYSRQLRSLRCRSARARTRRLLHAFISQLRDEIMDRLRLMQNRMTRRSLHHAKGGTRKIKYKSRKIRHQK
jgi:hypothetical protein